MFHVVLLTSYREMEFHSANYNQPPPDLVGEEEQYKVEQVLDECIYGHWKKKQYLVKQKGYPDSDNQWLDAKDMENAQELIAEFHNLNPEFNSHIKRALKHFASPHPLSSLSPTLTSTSKHMSDALHRTSVHRENTDPLPILPHSSTPIPDEAPIHIQNWITKFLRVCVLCHGRDVHPMWVKSFTKTLSNKGRGFCSTRAKSEEDIDSY